MIDRLRGLLDGRTTRAEVLAWTRELWQTSGLGEPLRAADAASVFESLCSLDRRHGDDQLIRPVDLRVYLRWLTEGECFHADEDQLFTLERDVEAFAAWTGTATVRWWYTGIGWWVSTRFCTPARGMPFVAHGMLERPGVMDIVKRRSDDFNAAVVDLFEALAIDDADVSFLHPQVDVRRLPAWALWRQDDNGNRFEMARYRSYAKARAQWQLYTDRGHKQTYWIEPA